jgi:sorbitol/mannitol transport system permease protein
MAFLPPCGPRRKGLEKSRLEWNRLGTGRAACDASQPSRRETAPKKTTAGPPPRTVPRQTRRLGEDLALATQQTQTLGKILVSPAVILLLIISLVPLAVTIYFSFLNYNLLDESSVSWAGFDNYTYFLADDAFIGALINTLIIVLSVLIITTVLGVLVALLMDQAVIGLNIVRLLVIAPFFVMPTVSALVWKNLLMHPVSGFFAWIATSLGLQPIDWFTDYPLAAIILIIAWQWLPFAALILLTALQSLDGEQKEAAEMDGAGALSTFFYITLPHLARPITVVILIETIFLLTVFAEIYVTTGGGDRTNNLAFLIYSAALKQYDIGAASAGGLVAVVLANIIAFFLVRLVGKNLDA